MISLSAQERTSNEYLLGKTRMGKTTYILWRVVNDMRAGRGLAVVDPKGDLVWDILSYVPYHRRKDVILLDVANTEQIFGYNFLDLPANATEHAIKTAVNHVMEMFSRLWGDLFLEIPVIADVLRNTCHIAAVNPGYTLADIFAILDDDALRAQLLPNVRNRFIRQFWQEEWPKRDKWEYTKTTRPRIRAFVTDDMLMRIIGQPHSTIDFRKCIDEKKIVLIRIPQDDFGEAPTKMLGTLLLLGITKAVFSRGNDMQHLERVRELFPIYIDEYNLVMTHDTATLLTKGGGFGTSTVIAHQDRTQLKEDPEQLGATLNAGTTVCFQLIPSDADMLAGIFNCTPPEPKIIGYHPKLAYAFDVFNMAAKHSNPAVIAAYEAVRSEMKRMEEWIPMEWDMYHLHLDFYPERIPEAYEALRAFLYMRMVSQNFTYTQEQIDALRHAVRLCRYGKKEAAQKAADLFHALGNWLIQEPIRIPSGQDDLSKPMYDSVRSNYQDMQNKIANELTTLPRLTAKVRSPHGEETIRVSRPTGALSDGWTPDVSRYTTPRHVVDARMVLRQQAHRENAVVLQTRRLASSGKQAVAHTRIPLPEPIAQPKQRKDRKPVRLRRSR